MILKVTLDVINLDSLKLLKGLLSLFFFFFHICMHSGKGM